MLTLVLIAAGYALVRATAFAITSLRNLPRANDDMVFF